MWKAIVAAVALTPVAALFIGAAVLAQAIGENWDKATTASLVTGLVAVCGGGFVVIALILSLVVGIPLATRFFFEAGVARRAFDAPSPVVDVYGRPALPRPWAAGRPPMAGRDPAATDRPPVGKLAVFRAGVLSLVGRRPGRS